MKNVKKLQTQYEECAKCALCNKIWNEVSPDINYKDTKTIWLDNIRTIEWAQRHCDHGLIIKFAREIPLNAR